MARGPLPGLSNAERRTPDGSTWSGALRAGTPGSLTPHEAVSGILNAADYLLCNDCDYLPDLSNKAAIGEFLVRQTCQANATPQARSHPPDGLIVKKLGRRPRLTQAPFPQRSTPLQSTAGRFHHPFGGSCAVLRACRIRLNMVRTKLSARLATRTTWQPMVVSTATSIGPRYALAENT